MAPKLRLLIATSVVVSIVCVMVVQSSGHPGKLHHPLSVDRVPAAQVPPFLRASTASSDQETVHYEKGIVVKTVLDGNRLNMSIYSTSAVPSQDFVYAMDQTASQILKIRLPIDQGFGTDVARRVAGDGECRTGYIDGWGVDSLLNHPKGMAVDGDGNVYFADVRNRVIRKMSPSGYVTTVAGQANKTGHADGDGTKALFSADFDLTFVPRNCSLLIADRGNQRLRVIELQPPLECHFKSSEPSANNYLWEIVSFVFLASTTILSFALHKEKVQTRDLQDILASAAIPGRKDALPLMGNPNGQGSGEPAPNNRDATTPLLADSAATQLPDLISSWDLPSQDPERDQTANLLANSAADPSRNAEDDSVLSISSAGDEADRTSTPPRGTVRSVEHDLLSDSESLMTGPNDFFSRHFDSNSADFVPAGQSSVQEELKRASHRALEQFSLTSGK